MTSLSVALVEISAAHAEHKTALQLADRTVELACAHRDAISNRIAKIAEAKHSLERLADFLREEGGRTDG